MQIIGIKTPLFTEEKSLIDFITKNIPKLNDGDILAITSKIVALSENRIAKIEEKDSLIIQESKKTITTPWATLTLQNDGWGINAGIDESNANELLILLPKNPTKTAEILCNSLKKQYGILNLGLIITDTRSVPLRVGTIGRTLGFFGFNPLKDYIGRDDLFGRKSRVTQSNVSDALAAAAVLIMGEGDERIPLVQIKNAPVVFTKGQSLSKKEANLFLLPENDIYSYLFNFSESENDKPSKLK
ncbi:MAG: hypothetical protein RLZZ230_442 [Candidatus Parcubacteria bacterium]|jgi:coenzyme F420-0:L-glutamate ligase